MGRKKLTLDDYCVFFKVYVPNARELEKKYRSLRRWVQLYVSEEEKVVLISCHGGGKDYDYKSSGGKIADPAQVFAYRDFYEAQDYTVKIGCCHPTSVGDCYPDLQKNILGYGWHNDLIWVWSIQKDWVAVAHRI